MTKIQQTTRDAAIVRQTFSEPPCTCKVGSTDTKRQHELHCVLASWSHKQFKVGPL